MEENLFDTNVLMGLYKKKRNNISGYTTIMNIVEYPKALDFFHNLEVIYPRKNDFKSSIKLSKELYLIGKPIPAIDILIASISYNMNLKLISYDSHFTFINEVWSDFKFSNEIK
ncbi:MAG: type II toxin-antitoxin system VapC family toxin [Candidatus Lokiarchaeota archaeon]|nr:type II toxin-antitoxin system VapC family toxin [Candidatus Lokiarchaeota archaeon]MBD3199182.1 type II toxin-antitoxin system VapC family toxin [Candidatus Lokiarchaeota archaeon]